VTGGTLDAANSKNVTLTGLSTDGLSTCLKVTSGTPHNVVAMIDNSGANPLSTSVAGTVTPSVIASSCPAGSNVLITTVSNQAFTPTVPFYATVN
jgi:hypothetical protein